MSVVEAEEAEGRQGLDGQEQEEELEEQEEPEPEEPLRFGTTSTVAPFQVSGSLLIPRVREDELEPERSLRLLNLDTSWLHPPEPAPEPETEAEDPPGDEPEQQLEREPWRSDDVKTHQKLIQLEKEIEQKHLAWKHTAGLCVPVEQLQPTNGDPVRAQQLQDEIRDKLDQVAALHRERAEVRRHMAEEWRTENTAAAQAAISRRSHAWRHVIADAHRKHKSAALQMAEQVSKELDIALRPWSTPEAAEQRLGTRPSESLRKFLVSIDLEGHIKAFQAEGISTALLQNLRRADLSTMLCEVGLDTDEVLDRVWCALHSGESTRDIIRAAFEAGVVPDEYGAPSGLLNLRGKVKGSKAALLVGTLLRELSAPLQYTKLDLSLCELSGPALREISKGLQQGYGGVDIAAPVLGLRVLDLHGTKWRLPERGRSQADRHAGQLTTGALSNNHEKACTECCAVLAEALPDSLEELSIVSTATRT